MARTRSRHYGDIQLAILRKAAALFATRGYERTSISDLADACELSRGALYHYFQSKEALLYALLDTLTQGLLERLREAKAQGGSPVEVLRRMIDAFVEHNAASPKEQIILLRDLGSLSEHEQAQIRKVEGEIVNLVADMLVSVDTQGRIRRETKKVYTMLLFGMINYTYTWYDPTGRVSPQQFSRMATDIFLDGFLATLPSAAASTRRVRR